MHGQVAKLGIKKVTLLYVQKYYSMSLATSINEVCKILEVSFVFVHVHIYEIILSEYSSLLYSYWKIHVITNALILREQYLVRFRNYML